MLAPCMHLQDGFFAGVNGASSVCTPDYVGSRRIVVWTIHFRFLFRDGSNRDLFVNIVLHLQLINPDANALPREV